MSIGASGEKGKGLKESRTDNGPSVPIAALSIYAVGLASGIMLSQPPVMFALTHRVRAVAIVFEIAFLAMPFLLAIHYVLGWPAVWALLAFLSAAATMATDVYMKEAVLTP
ncbi:unnamed protein product [Amoebophrya sp. A25]|nr:unnamed protein product [Amoebophrya sp. A25]|eukprot:GSA25T00003676001.1